MTKPEAFYKIAHQTDGKWALYGSYLSGPDGPRVHYVMATFGNKFDAREGLERYLNPVEELYDEKGNLL